MSTSPPLLDTAAVRRAAERATPTYDANAIVQARVREEMLARLELLAFEPHTVVDLGAGTGLATRALRRRFRKARVLAIDIAPRMLVQARTQSTWLARFDRICADGTRLPLRNGSVDLVYSNLMLPFVADLDAALREVRRVLSPRGYFSFTTFGPDTLRELRSAWASVDEADHVHPFFDMHDIGDALGRAGFADPVMDVDRYQLTYPNTRALMQDLKATGAQNALADRRRGLTGRAGLRALEAAYEILRDGDGRLPVSCEVIYGQAWCPGTEAPQRGRRGETVIPLDSLRRRRDRPAE